MGKDTRSLIEKQILTEMPIDTGNNPDFIHPDNKSHFANRDHPLAKHPAYPDFAPRPGQVETNWEEVVASKQYQDTMGRINTFFRQLHGGEVNLQTFAQVMVLSLQDAMALEKPYRRALEKLAIELLFELEEFKTLKQSYDAGDFLIDAKLGEKGDLQNAKLQPEENEEDEDSKDRVAANEFKNFSPELEKRRFINAMISGGAVSKNYAYQLFGQKLSKISPELPVLYGFCMAGTELGYFAASGDSINRMALNHAGGSEEVKPNQDGKFVIRVRAMIFPMLIQELAKGLLELASYDALPQDAKLASEVVNKADLANEETWSMIMGRGLWMRFVDAVGADSTDITVNLYNRITQLPPEEFNHVMKIIQTGGPEAVKLLSSMAEQLRKDIEDDKHGVYADGNEEPETPTDGNNPSRFEDADDDDDDDTW